MKKLIVILILALNVINSSAQERKLIPLLWTSHSKSTDIVGVSLGLFPKEIFRDTTLTRTYGIKIEAPGIGLFFPLIPKSPISKTKESYLATLEEIPTEKVYGINLSSGSNYQTEVYGISLALVGQYLHKIDGITIAGLGNLTERYNGISISGLGNESFKTNGITISGLVNASSEFNGIQISTQNYVHKKGVGIQIGLFNKASNFKGIQLGLWNKNDKRSMPIINWNFKS